MRDFTKRPNNRRQTPRFLGSIAAVIALSFITFGAAHAAFGMYGKFTEAAQGNADAEQNLADVKAQEAQMSTTVDALSGERGQEAAIRQTYGVALPGEGEIQIIEEAPTSTQAAVPEPNILQRVVRALFAW